MPDGVGVCIIATQFQVHQVTEQNKGIEHQVINFIHEVTQYYYSSILSFSFPTRLGNKIK